MDRILRILHLEDDPDDAELIARALKSHGLACDIVLAGDGPAFEAALRRGGIDVILSDFALPRFDGTTALQMARRIAPGVPFILISGTIGEEAAVESLRGGATDYILKDRLNRLGPAVERALAEAEERRKLMETEARLRQAAKMEAVGSLAGGIAHDFNNLLGVIMGYGELIVEKLGADDPLRERMDQINRAAARAASLTRQLLAFSRRQTITPKILDLNGVVHDLEKMLRRLIGEDVDLQTACVPDPWRVEADPGQLEQVILNLAVNARDAMPAGGRLTLATANVEVDETQARAYPGARPGPHVVLRVSDTGVGMGPEVKARVFEPFFTTKDPGRGTGLGLATVYGIVKQSGGFVEVASDPGQGATFTVFLPRAEGAPHEAAAVAEAPPPGGTEAVLVIEDDRRFLDVIREALVVFGYTVIAVRDADEALTAVAGARPLDLVITDVILPKMNGRVLAERLLAARPGLKVLYMSGYTTSGIVEHGILGAGLPFLQKPFALVDLARKVRDLLGPGAAAA